MKKVFLIATVVLIAIILAITPLTIEVKDYQKVRKYTDQKKVIEEFNIYSRVVEEKENKDGTIEYLTPFEAYESMSKRLRLYFDKAGKYNFKKSMPLFIDYKIEELGGAELEFLEKRYLSGRNEIPNYDKYKEVNYYKIEGNCLEHAKVLRENIGNDGKLNLEDFDGKNIMKTSYYVVVIDEGEGYVVDDLIRR